MSKTKLFIEKARALHGDRYEYTNVEYVNAKTKVSITCANHGDFEQTPSNHLMGYGCAKCSGRHIYSTQEWIQKAIAVHGDHYGYDRVIYIRSQSKIIITCKKHGDFEQIPNNHLNGSGCIKCGFEEIAAKLSQEAKDSFIEKACAIHGNKYDYLNTVYVRSGDKVIITCKNHGDFEQIPKDHLNGYGCAKCSGNHRYSTQEWVEEAVAVHGDLYDYGRTVYVRANDKLTINCKKHGDFDQTPNKHLSGQGCPSCPARYDQPTNLYLMHDGLGKVKVGYAIDLNRRISRLNRDAPFKAELLETWTLPDTPTVRKIEGKVHRKLAKYHAGLSGFDGASEWFNTSPERAKGAILKALSGAEVLGHSEANSLQLALI